MKVLILSGRFGFGHEMAANAVREEFERQDQNVEIIQKDLPSYFYPRISKIIYRIFGIVAERYHGIYNLVYKISGRLNSGGRPGGPVICRKFRKMMERYLPDVIVCTHPFCGKAAAAYKAKTDSQIPLVTCITDISKHKEWFTRQADIYLVPTAEVKEHLTGLGAVPEDILVTGVPVRRQFLENTGREAGGADICKSRGKQVLIMGGGLGIMPELEELIYTLHGMPGVRTTVITGKNHKLYDMWAGCFEDVDVLGYVEDIGTYMRSADLVITKAGGITLFELLHSGVPMYIIRPFLEQEIVNAEYAQEKGFAEVVWGKNEDFALGLRKVLEDPEKTERMRRCMARARQEMLDTGIDEAVRAITERASWFKGEITYDTDKGYNNWMCMAPGRSAVL